MSLMKYDLDPDLEVFVVKARGLRDADWAPGGGYSDPYCIVGVKGRKEIKKFQTKVINDTMDPVWNAKGYIKEFAYGDILEFTINDKDVGKSDDLLGKIEVPTDKMFIGGLPKGFEGELKLKQTSDTAKAVDAYLTVKIKVGPQSGLGAEAKAAPKAASKAKAQA
ncbi:unnamed protein product [Polarella glacialis]|uniref:C2 domain-containing protein n=1 Tax=Polarella glacialis TaxID=89957 RepID=A0A813KHC7_POLGL|nr:unnamed protein product [Polarella glacialis]